MTFWQIRNELREMAEKEAMKLFRLARRAVEHSCSRELVAGIRDEAYELHTISCYDTGRLIGFEFEYTHKYAFKW